MEKCKCGKEIKKLIRNEYCMKCYCKARKNGSIKINERKVGYDVKGITMENDIMNYAEDPTYLETYDKELNFEIEYYNRTGKILHRNI